MTCNSCGAIHSVVRTLNPGCYTLPPSGGSVVSDQEMLITREYYKLITSSEASDELIDSAIRSVSSRIESFLGRKLLFKENHVQYVTGHNTTKVQLELFPIYEVRFIGFNCCACEKCSCCSDQYLLGDSGRNGLLMSPAGFPLTSRNTLNSATIEMLDANKYPGLIIVYSGGYLAEDTFTPSEETLPDCTCESSMYLPQKQTVLRMPEEIRFLVVKEASAEIKAVLSPSCGENIKREKLDEYEVSFFSPADMQMGNITKGATSGLSFRSQETLMPYRLIY